MTYPKNSCESKFHSASRGLAVAPRPPDTASLGVPGDRPGTDYRLGELGAWRGVLLATHRSLLGVAENR